MTNAPIRESDKRAADSVLEMVKPGGIISEPLVAQIIANAMAEERERFDAMAACIEDIVAQNDADLFKLWDNSGNTGYVNGDFVGWLLEAAKRYEDKNE